MYTLCTVNKFIAILAAISLHFSVCTGGSFSALSAFAGSFVENEQVMMTPAGTDFFLCRTSTPAGNVDEFASNEEGCSDSDECLIQSASRKREEISDDSIPSLDDATDAFVYITYPSTLASEVNVGSLSGNPLFADARLLAHSLYKRE